MFNVGNCYAHGYGIEQDDKQAEEWYLKAVRHGNKKAASACAIWLPNRKKRKNGLGGLKSRFPACLPGKSHLLDVDPVINTCGKTCPRPEIDT